MEEFDPNAPVYEWEDAIDYIAQRCTLDRDTIEQILLLEEGYMRSIGIIEDVDEDLDE